MKFTKAARYRANYMGPLSVDSGFARSVAAQEAARWTEYLQKGTRESLQAWRQTRELLATARRREAA